MFDFIKQKLKSESYRQILLVTSLLIISRFFGFIRQAIIGSSYIGDSAVYSDMFINAQKIQDILIAVLIMGTILSTLTPTGAKILAIDGEDKFNRYIRFNFWIFLSVYFFIALFISIFIEDILRISFNKFYNQYSNLGLLTSYVDSARVLSFGVVFFAANTLFQTYLNLKNSFFWNNLAGIISNLFIIIALFMSPRNFVFPVSIALVLSFAFVSLVQLYACFSTGLTKDFFKLHELKNDYLEFKIYFKEDLKNIFPKFFIVPLTIIASFLISAWGGEKLPTFYENSSIIQGIFLTIISAVGMVILPKLSLSLHTESNNVFVQKINIYLKKFLPLTVVGSIVTALLAKYLLLFVLSAKNFRSGKWRFIDFTSNEQLQVQIIQILSVSIIFLAINEILIKYFLVKNKVITLLKINSISIAFLYFLALFLNNMVKLDTAIAISIAFTTATAFQSIAYYVTIFFDKTNV
jgi:putative peptidoglycan lipid II flippase